VAEGWARATPPGAVNGAAYVRIVNNGGGADTLVAVDTPVAGEVSIHRTVVENDRAAMVALDGGLEVPAGATVMLAPGGAHLMLENLVAPLREGDTIAIGLVFTETGRVEANFTVLGVGANGPGTP
jgi:copper(I)-binding protein